LGAAAAAADEEDSDTMRLLSVSSMLCFVAAVMVASDAAESGRLSIWISRLFAGFDTCSGSGFTPTSLSIR
jgi:hypothetical protein